MPCPFWADTPPLKKPRGVPERRREHPACTDVCGLFPIRRRCAAWAIRAMPTASCGASTVRGCVQWAANAASVTDVSGRFITMSLRTHSILCLLWWTKSNLYPSGDSSATRPRGPLQKIGRTYRPHTGSVMHRKAIKPPKMAQNRLKSCGFRTFQTAVGEGGKGPPPVPSATPSAVSADLHTGKI